MRHWSGRHYGILACQKSTTAALLVTYKKYTEMLKLIQNLRWHSQSHFSGCSPGASSTVLEFYSKSEKKMAENSVTNQIGYREKCVNSMDGPPLCCQRSVDFTLYFKFHIVVSSLSMILSHDFPDSQFLYIFLSGFQLSIPKIVWDNIVQAVLRLHGSLTTRFSK